VRARLARTTMGSRSRPATPAPRQRAATNTLTRERVGRGVDAAPARYDDTVILTELGLSLKQAKTRIVHLREGGEGLDCLGFHHRCIRARDPRYRHLTFLARWPSREAMQHARSSGN
jgi:hypothetical protein